jgi:GT2 family glycosyltransferase
VGTVSVIVPSYRRPERLLECVEGLQRSERPVDEIVVVLRIEDDASVAAITDRFPGVELVLVSEPGVLAAMAAGARRARGDVLAFVDDDAVPKPDWLRRIIACLEEDRVGGAGGRDIVTDPDVLPRTTVAGCFTRSGKLIGNHHTISGPPREVDVLKAAHFEVATCLWARRRGWRLVLDPGAEVLHIPGPRFDSDIRARPSLGAGYRMSFNLTWCLLSMRPPALTRAIVYGLLVGDRSSPGILRTGIAIVRAEGAVLRRVLPSLTGQLCAIALFALGRTVPMTTFPRTQAHVNERPPNSEVVRNADRGADIESPAPASSDG